MSSTKLITRDLERLSENIAKLEARSKEYKASGNVELEALYTKDAADLRVIHSLVSKNNLRTAGRTAWLLDTAVRERIPNRLYNLICDAYERS